MRSMSVTKDFFFAESIEFTKNYLRCYIDRNVTSVTKDKNEQQKLFVKLVENWPIKSERDILEQVVLEFTG
jgi:hypothetical protein